MSGEVSSNTEKNVDTDFVFKLYDVQQLQINTPNISNSYGRRVVCGQEEDLYTFGGLESEIRKFNGTTNTWTVQETKGRRHPGFLRASIFVKKSKLTVFGGTSFLGLTNEINVCDLKTLTWRRTMTTGPAPAPRYDCGIFIDQGNLYIVGGIGSERTLLDVHKLDLCTSRWETLWVGNRGLNKVEEPQRWIGPQIVVYKNKLILLGVDPYVRSAYMSTVQVFDLVARKWSSLTTLGDLSATNGFPPVRYKHCLVQRGDEVFICGGQYKQCSFLYDLWKLNLSDLQWTKLPIPLPIHVFNGTAALSSTGSLYLFNNVLHEESVWKCWLTVPSLKELTWGAVLHLQPNLKDKQKDQLVESGIPRDLVHRLEI